MAIVLAINLYTRINKVNLSLPQLRNTSRDHNTTGESPPSNVCSLITDVTLVHSINSVVLDIAWRLKLIYLFICEEGFFQASTGEVTQ